MGVCLTILGTLILIGNFLVGTGSTSPVSETDVIRHIDYLIGFLLIAAGAITETIQAGNKNSQQESRRLAAIDETRKNIAMPSPSPVSGQDPKKKQPMTSKDLKIGVIIAVGFAIVCLVLWFLKFAGLLVS